MRLFVAIELPARLTERLARRVEGVRPELPPARWVPARNLHLTLRFLGEVEEGRVEPLAGSLAPAFAASPPLELELRDAGAFPPSRPARVVWVGLDGCRELVELQRRVAEAADRTLGLAPERRPYHPHLTLARCRRPWPRRAVERWSRALSGRLGDPFRVERGVLMRSRLGAGGARYSVIEAFPLEGVG